LLASAFAVSSNATNTLLSLRVAAIKLEKSRGKLSLYRSRLIAARPASTTSDEKTIVAAA
jgi:hypothetical protein